MNLGIIRIALEEKRLSGGELRCAATDPLVGTLGPRKIGDLMIDGSEGGALDLISGASLDSTLTTQALATGSLVTLPEPEGHQLAMAGVLGLLLLARRNVRRGWVR